VTVAADAEQFARRYPPGHRRAIFRARRRGGSLSRGPNSWSGGSTDDGPDFAHAAAARARMKSGWDERLRARIARRRPHGGSRHPGVVVKYLLLFQTPLLWLLASPLKLSAPPQPPTASSCSPAGVGSREGRRRYQERVKQAADLYRLGPPVTSSSRQVLRSAFPEAEVMRALAIDNGVPASAIDLETRAANTHENVVFSQRILDAHGGA